MFFRALGGGGGMALAGNKIDRIADHGLRHHFDRRGSCPRSRKTFECHTADNYDRDWFCLLAAMGNAMGAVLSRKAYAIAGAAHQNIDGATGGYQRLIGGLFVAAICLLAVRRSHVAAQFTDAQAPKMPSVEKWRRAWPWVLANSFAGQTLGVTCYQWALKTTPTGLVLAIVSTTPLVVIPFSFMMEGEKIEARSIAGGLVAVAGAVFLVCVR